MWLDDMEKRSPVLFKSITILGVLALVLLAFKAVFTYLLPFLLAFLMAAAMEPIVAFLQRRRLPRGLAVSLAMFVCYGILFAAAFFIVARLVAEASHFTKNVPDYGQALTAVFNRVLEWGKRMYVQLPKEALGPIQDSLQSLAGQLTQVLARLAGGAIRLLTALPDLLMFAMFTIIATFFMSRDRARFREFFVSQLPPRTFAKLSRLKASLGRSLAGFLKAQLMLLTLTFIQCFIGLSLIGIRYALVISLFTALVDILPVLGTGTVLIPWGVVSLVIGKTKTGIALLVLYLVIMTVRYMIEPKVVGSQLGLHPLVSLLGMFVGLKAFGVVGLLLGPAVVVVVLAFLRSGLMPGGQQKGKTA